MSHAETATWIHGLTSLALVTIPLIVTRDPIAFARTSLSFVILLDTNSPGTITSW